MTLDPATDPEADPNQDIRPATPCAGVTAMLQHVPFDATCTTVPLPWLTDGQPHEAILQGTQHWDADALGTAGPYDYSYELCITGTGSRPRCRPPRALGCRSSGAVRSHRR